MGFLSSLFRKVAVIEIQDAVFGTLKIVEKKDGAAYWFETDELIFHPGGHKITATIRTSQKEPTQEQRDFFRQIEKDYPALTQNLIPLIEEEFRNWKPGFTVATFETEFRLVYISIPMIDKFPTAWEWAFDTVHDANHALTFSMLGDVPQSLIFDG